MYSGIYLKSFSVKLTKPHVIGGMYVLQCCLITLQNMHSSDLILLLGRIREVSRYSSCNSTTPCTSVFYVRISKQNRFTQADWYIVWESSVERYIGCRSINISHLFWSSCRRSKLRRTYKNIFCLWRGWSHTVVTDEL